MTFIPNVGDFVGPIVLVFILAALIALAVTPVVRRLMLRYEIVDRPEARRVNTIPVPRGGG
jgi:UDP-GlcNAc:undecaprenyl-phosphate GlcNAc-1-phosphate transferase